MNAFPVGTVCIIQNLVKDTHLNGMECTITGPLSMRNLITSAGYMVNEAAYLTDAPMIVPGCKHTYMAPRFLRRKQPPQTFTGEQQIIELFNVTPVPQEVAA